MPDYSSVNIFRKMWTTLVQLLSAKLKEEEKNAGRASGWACRTRVQNFRVYLSKTAWAFGILCGKISNIRYFLHVTWF